MTIKFKCPHCEAQLGAGVKLAGTKGKCPKCGKEITVPEEGSEIQSDKKQTVEE
jgi:predicted RNA-binding Zn-ribbon protein involved in translation (DUF1610 family)